MHKSKEDFNKDMKFIHDWLKEIKNPKWYNQSPFNDFMFWILLFYIISVIVLTINNIWFQ